MTKADLISTIAKDAKITKAGAEKALNAFIKVGKKYEILGLTKEQITAKYGA